MKAIAYGRYGSPDVLEPREIDQTVRKDRDVLVRICGAGFTPYNGHCLRGLTYPMRRMIAAQTQAANPSRRPLGVEAFHAGDAPLGPRPDV